MAFFGMQNTSAFEACLGSGVVVVDTSPKPARSTRPTSKLIIQHEPIGRNLSIPGGYVSTNQIAARRKRLDHVAKLGGGEHHELLRQQPSIHIDNNKERAFA
ncbi:hypothetical protein PC119_g17625 [Phytophthora cactorum]|nr:hypothetical protein PC119_g17625 [Phytophthora cactorum]